MKQSWVNNKNKWAVQKGESSVDKRESNINNKNKDKNKKKEFKENVKKKGDQRVNQKKRRTGLRNWIYLKKLSTINNTNIETDTRKMQKGNSFRGKNKSQSKR